MDKWKKHAQLKQGGTYMVKYERDVEMVTDAEFDECYSQEWCFPPLIFSNEVLYAVEWRELTKDEREAISQGIDAQGGGDSTGEGA